MSYVLCENGKSIEAKLQKEVLVCWNGGLQFQYGPEPGYRDTPRKKYAGFRGAPSSSEGGSRTYYVSFQGLIEKNEVNISKDANGKNGCERLATKDNPPDLLRL